MAIDPHALQLPSAWALWPITSAAGAVACFTARSARWRLVGAAVALAFVVLPLGGGFLARTLLVVAAARLVAAWPWRVSNAAVELPALWPFLAWALWREGLLSAFGIDCATLALVLAIALGAILRAWHSPRQERLFVLALAGCISISAAVAAAVPPSPWAVAVVFPSIYMVLGVPIVEAARRRPLQLAAAILAVAFALAL